MFFVHFNISEMDNFNLKVLRIKGRQFSIVLTFFLPPLIGHTFYTIYTSCVAI